MCDCHPAAIRGLNKGKRNEDNYLYFFFSVFCAFFFALLFFCALSYDGYLSPNFVFEVDIHLLGKREGKAIEREEGRRQEKWEEGVEINVRKKEGRWLMVHWFFFFFFFFNQQISVVGGVNDNKMTTVMMVIYCWMVLRGWRRKRRKNPVGNVDFWCH